MNNALFIFFGKETSNQLNYSTGYILLSEGIKENTGVEPASHDKEIQYTFAAQLTVQGIANSHA